MSHTFLLLHHIWTGTPLLTSVAQWHTDLNLEALATYLQQCGFTEAVWTLSMWHTSSVPRWASRGGVQCHCVCLFKCLSCKWGQPRYVKYRVVYHSDRLMSVWVCVAVCVAREGQQPPEDKALVFFHNRPFDQTDHLASVRLKTTTQHETKHTLCSPAANSWQSVCCRLKKSGAHSSAPVSVFMLTIDQTVCVHRMCNVEGYRTSLSPALRISYHWSLSLLCFDMFHIYIFHIYKVNTLQHYREEEVTPGSVRGSHLPSPAGGDEWKTR